MSAGPPTNQAVSSQLVVLTILKLYFSSHFATIPVSFMKFHTGSGAKTKRTTVGSPPAAPESPEPLLPPLLLPQLAATAGMVPAMPSAPAARPAFAKKLRRVTPPA